MHLAAVLALLLATILPLSPAESWWVRSLDFPRLQLLLFALLLLFVQFLLMDYSLALNLLTGAVTTACAVYHLMWILPYTLLARREVQWRDTDLTSDTVSILCANVLQSNRNAAGLLQIVKSIDVDIVLTLETNQWWEEQLDVLTNDFCHSVKCPLENLFGMHLYSRLPLHNAEVKFLVSDEIPSIHCEVELESGRRVQAHFLHPVPPVPEYSKETTERDAELIVVAKSLTGNDRPVIVAGDLNDVAWSYTTRLFRKISGLLDPRVGRGFFNTFHAEYWFLRWPLDHLFHSSHFAVSKIQRMPHYGSDHFALYTELALQVELEPEQEGLTANNSDKRVADDKIERGGVSVEDVPGP